jgi:hypothetical protein
VIAERVADLAAGLAAAAGIRAEPLGPHQLQGFKAVELCRLSI